MRKLLIILSLLCVGVIVFISYSKSGKVVKSTMLSYVTPVSHINEEGNTVTTRVNVLENFIRLQPISESFSHYVQNYSLKPSGEKVINYNGNPYWYQAGHVGVLDIPVPSNGLQQCADALIRIRAEYLWQQNLKDKIGFKFTSGHYCSWSKYSCLLYTSPSPRDLSTSRMPSSA